VNQDNSFTFLHDLETVIEGIPMQDFQVNQQSMKKRALETRNFLSKICE
jgi:hypothetical protein